MCYVFVFSEKGPEGSKGMAKIDSERMKKYRHIINEAGRKCGVDPAVIAGIISRESRAGNQLVNGWGDNNKAFGLMQVESKAADSSVFPKTKLHLQTLLIWFLQIDVIPPPNGGGHEPSGNWHSLTHLIQATEILVEFIERIRKKFPTWNANQHLKGLVDRRTQTTTAHCLLPAHV